MTTDPRQMTPDELNREAAIGVMGWEWRRWKPTQIPGSIAEWEHARNVVFLMKPQSSSWDSTEPADPASGVRRDSKEHEAMRQYWPHSSSVAWHAMLPPSPATSIADAWELVEKMRANGWGFQMTAVTSLDRKQHFYAVNFGKPDIGHEYVDDPSAPRAITIAAIMAKRETL